MKPLRVSPEAEIDAFEAALWYEGERAGLGGEFLGAVREVLNHIARLPNRFPIVFGTIRRAMLRRFPFGAFFVVEENQATVIAIMHLHRDPGTWEQRG
jgi:hypothetical protein